MSGASALAQWNTGEREQARCGSDWIYSSHSDSAGVSTYLTHRWCQMRESMSVALASQGLFIPHALADMVLEWPKHLQGRRLPTTPHQIVGVHTTRTSNHPLHAPMAWPRSGLLDACVDALSREAKCRRVGAGTGCMSAAAVNHNPLNVCERTFCLLLKLQSRYLSVVAFWVLLIENCIRTLISSPPTADRRLIARQDLNS
jgi:hypothetical protein